MTFFESVRTCLVKYADFKGSATRSEFWQWVLFVLVVAISLYAVSYRASTAFEVAILVPTLAVLVRRLHDTDRSGWLVFVALIPFIGWILLIAACAQEGRHPNRFQPEAGAEA